VSGFAVFGVLDRGDPVLQVYRAAGQLEDFAAGDEAARGEAEEAEVR
jgi:hypothetical protein